MRIALALVFAACLAGCGAVWAPQAPASCAAAFATIGRNVYDQSLHGRAVTASEARLAGSAALSSAVARGDRAAARRALRPLLRAQIKRLVITRHGHRWLSVGHAAALAPVRDGAYTFSVTTRAETVRLLHAITGARVVIGHGAGFAATAFPHSRVRIALQHPRCTADPVQTVARRIYGGEQHGAHVQAVLRHIARDPRFVRAVAIRDPVALRTQIVRFFRDPHLHVVRIRATTPSGALIGDVGGPHVLAPASRAVRANGKRIGRVTLSVQDDAGYVKLVHRFTGATVQLGTPRADFHVQAFPNGRLNVALLH